MISPLRRHAVTRRMFSAKNHVTPFVRFLSSSQQQPLDEHSAAVEDDSKTAPENNDSSTTATSGAQRIWKGVWPSHQPPTTIDHNQPHNHQPYEFWKERVVDSVNKDGDELPRLYKRLEARELQGGSMPQQRLGVLHADPATDMLILCENYTVKAIASALRDREDALQCAAMLCEEENWDALRDFLRVYHPRYVLERRYGPKHFPQKEAPPILDITQTLQRNNLELIRKALMRMPRTVTQAHDKRAGVVIALCTVDGVPCILLEKRAPHLRSYPNEVALPGGMVCDVQDPSIVSTCLREMKEEISGLPDEPVDVLGVLRCNWGDIQHLVNIAVTPVVCYWGELPEHLQPNAEEVAQIFTVPLSNLLDRSLWIHRDGFAPIFTGGPDVVWGLSGYILQRFAKDILYPIVRRQRGGQSQRRGEIPPEESPDTSWL